MTSAPPDAAACDREPIHLPGAIQPHGLMLVLDEAGRVAHVAGDVEGRLGVTQWLGAPAADLLGEALAPAPAEAPPSGEGLLLGRLATAAGEAFDVRLCGSGRWRIVELCPTEAVTPTAVGVLSGLEVAATRFARAPSVEALCDVAADEFRTLTGYDRVMVYRFLEDNSGVVVAESLAEGERSFMNHRFPASDIPAQARALYVRNLTRAIPDASYTPAPLRPAWSDPAPLDMSDAVLRSVSPVHLQYLTNMGVRASASVSVVKDGALWGLIACHDREPKPFPYDVQVACRALAGALCRQIDSRQEAQSYRERIRLRGLEDELVDRLSRETSPDQTRSDHLAALRRGFDSDGVAVLRGSELARAGVCPPPEVVRALAGWLAAQAEGPVFETRNLAERYSAAEAWRREASGVLAIVLASDEPWVLMWFRAETAEEVEWAGNPHKKVTGPNGALTPRRSFEVWREAMRGKARPWTVPQVEAAARLRAAILHAHQTRRVRDLNSELSRSLQETERLLEQKQFLLGEVNHRVQNSLQLVSSFLSMQAREADDTELKAALAEAQRRLAAVGLVHRRLYQAEEVTVVDLARYVDELTADMLASMGPEWAGQMTLDLEPVMVRADRAVTLGLILTELVINANKYAYGGGPGPIAVGVAPWGDGVRLSVGDHGVGRTGSRRGFGTRMMDAQVAQLRGELRYEDNQPGLRAELTVPGEAHPWPAPDLGGRGMEWGRPIG